MRESAGRRFDAQGSRTTIAKAAALLREQWRVAVGLIVVALVLELISFGLLYFDATGARSVSASIASVSIFVSVDPQASHAEVDALGPLIRATPGIGESTLRSKDDAIRALVAKGLPPPDGRNPLPDVWIVRIDPAAIFNGERRTVATVAADLRRAVGSLPKVDAVTTDEAWLSKVDALSAGWTKDWPVAFGIALLLLSFALACAAFLAGQALRSASASEPLSVRVLAIFGAVSGMVSSGLSSIAFWWLVNRLNVGSVGPLQLTWSEFAERKGMVLGFTTLSTMLILAAFAIAGGGRNK